MTKRPHKTNVEVGLTLQDLRLEAKMTQKDVAGYLGVTQSAVCLLEAGKISLSLSNANKLAALWGTTSDDIYTGEVWNKPKLGDLD